MTLVGFMDGSKSIRYYDAKTRSIKVSRNVAFNENEEPKELEDFVKIPGLQAEGENSEGPTLQTELEIQSLTPKIPPTPSDNLLKQTEVPELPRLLEQILLTTEGWTTPNPDYHHCVTHPNHLYLLTLPDQRKHQRLKIKYRNKPILLWKIYTKKY